MNAAVLKAGVELFATKGFSEVSDQDVRRLCGLRGGGTAWTKSDLVAALYEEAYKRYALEVSRIIDASPPVEDGIKALVAHHVKWMRDNPTMVRLLMDRRREVYEIARPVIRRIKADYLAKVLEWYRGHAEEGRVRGLDENLFYAVMIGPAHEIARRGTDSDEPLDYEQALRLLPDVAWEALRFQGPHLAASSSPLTAAEERVCLLLAKGLTNKEIAGRLFLAPTTVESHLKRIFRKLKMKTRAELAVWASRNLHEARRDSA